MPTDWNTPLLTLRLSEPESHNLITHISPPTQLAQSTIASTWLREETIVRGTRLLGAFTKLRKTIISFFMSICPSVRPHGTIRVSLDGFSWNYVFEVFQRSVEEIQVSLKSDKNNGYFTWRRFHIYHNISLNSSWNVDKSCRKIKTHILCSITFFPLKILPFMR
jgi:hypothetical protein